MKIMLDTHIALWAVLQSDALKEETKDLLLSPENEVFCSVISAPVHKDPFDRLLLSQSIVEGMTFVTHDAKIATFDTQNLLLV